MSATRIAACVLTVALAGCADLTSNGFDGLVQVVADVEPGSNLAVVTIRNDSPEPILLRSACAVGLQYRDGDDWQSLGVPCAAILSTPIEIDSDDELVLERRVGLHVTEPGENNPPQLPSGEYRFAAALTDADDNLLPEDVRTSNTFHIDG